MQTLKSLLKYTVVLMISLTVEIYANTIKCTDKKIGGYINVNNQNYLVVNDGDGKYGIFNSKIKEGILNGSLKVCTSHVVNMYKLFSLQKEFDPPIGNWDTSNVINMQGLFKRAYTFNQPLDKWDVSNVISMKEMFDRAFTFNQSINSWDTSNVKNMSRMFAHAISFNQLLNTWNTLSVKRMSHMFNEATSFNQPLNNWNVNSVFKREHSHFSEGSKLTIENLP